MPHSIFMGRPWPKPGEPLFLEDDTAAAIALAEEERNTCPACGYPKDWCRGAGSTFADYEVVQETCQVTLRLAQFQDGQDWKSKHPATQKATQIHARFREGHEPDMTAWLELHVGDAADGSDNGDR